MRQGRRIEILDTWRGGVIVSMVLYHACWDLVWIFGLPWAWFSGISAWVWQQSICMSFIFLSGFCWNLGRRPLQRGILVLASGELITAVTEFLSPADPIFFGILTLLGIAATGTCFLHPLLRRIPPAAGMTASLLLFLLFREWHQGVIGTFQISEAAAALPEAVRIWAGYPPPGFSSSDYFPILPWIFLFSAGYFAYGQTAGKGRLPPWTDRGESSLSWAGRHSLLLYLLHQPFLLMGMHLYFYGFDLAK